MKVFLILTISIISVFFLCILFFAIKTHRFTKTLFLNFFLGISVFAIIELTRKFTGMYIPINWYTVLASGVFGVPAICGLLCVQIIFI